MEEQSFDKVVTALYRASAGMDTWPVVMRMMAEAIGAWGIQLVGVDKSDGTLLFSHEGGTAASPESAFDYVRKYHQINPRVGPTLALGRDEWFHDHEHLSDDFVATDPFYQEFAIPYGARYCAATKVVDDTARLIVMAALRSSSAGPFSKAERIWLERFRVHLVEAFSLETDIARKLEPIRVGAALLDEFQRPMLLIDSQRAIRFSNRGAKKMLDQRDCVMSNAGCLRCTYRPGDQALTEVLHELRLNDGGLTYAAARPTRRFIKTMSTPSRKSIGLYLVALRPESTMASFGSDSVALVFFHDPGEKTAIDPMIVAETFLLTPAETRVAIALASGYTIADVALDRGVAVATVRAQLRSLFEKTGTHRQSELVRLVTTMPGLYL